ncbi:hypothetical protein ABE402_00755 [Bacillus smithii]|uniref:hypothetical protein n=1 Tax=Bacillus smithii TaxID=1479 RepID=UPI003D1A70AF
MKEFRWGRKAMTAVLVTSIVSAPLLPTESIFLPKAEAASVATSNVNAEIDQIANRFFKFYQYADAKTLGNVQYNIRKLNQANVLSAFAAAGGDLSKLKSKEKKEALVTLVKQTAAIVYTKHQSPEALSQAIKNFQVQNRDAFNTLFDQDGTVTADELVRFLKDLEPNLELSIIAGIKNGDSYDQVVERAVRNTLKNKEYANLNGRLANAGLNVQTLFKMQTILNDRFVDPANKQGIKPGRSTLLSSAFKAKGAALTKNQQNQLSFSVPVYPIGNVDLTRALTWSVDKPKVATVKGNQLYIKKAGDITVSAILGKTGIVLGSQSFHVDPTSHGKDKGDRPHKNKGPKHVLQNVKNLHHALLNK